MGGTIIKLAVAGHDVQVVVTTSNDRNGPLREEELRAAARVAGIKAPLFLGEKELNLVVSSDSEKRLFSLVHSEPDVVFTHWPVDVHPDHRNTAVLTIGRYLAKGVNTELYAFETCSSGRSSPHVRPQSLAFRPTHYSNVADVVDRKAQMLNCHQSQDPVGMWSGVGLMMRNRGAENGIAYAEAFVRLTRAGDQPDWLLDILRPSAWRLPRGIAPHFDPSAIGLPTS
jgi:LmbE family N-acetylglucosaminyl deacetylase